MFRDITVTGTSGHVTDAQLEALTLLLENARILRHGVCIGADAAAHLIARVLGGIEIIGYPGVNSAGEVVKRAHLDGFAELRPEKFFLDRNTDMANECLEVVALVSQEHSGRYRSGEWNTILTALRLGKPVTLVHPSGRLTVL